MNYLNTEPSHTIRNVVCFPQGNQQCLFLPFLLLCWQMKNNRKLFHQKLYEACVFVVISLKILPFLCYTLVILFLECKQTFLNMISLFCLLWIKALTELIGCWIYLCVLSNAVGSVFDGWCVFKRGTGIAMTKRITEIPNLDN